MSTWVFKWPSLRTNVISVCSTYPSPAHEIQNPRLEQKLKLPTQNIYGGKCTTNYELIENHRDVVWGVSTGSFCVM